MNAMKSKFRIFIAAMLFMVCLISVVCLLAVNGKAEQRSSAISDITETGVEFMTSVPAVITEYKAGNGTLTYVPASEGKTAQIILENAEIFAGTKVKYWSQNSTYVAIGAKGDVEVVLNGENRVYMHPTYSNTALLFYDSNVTVVGDGSLSVSHESEETKNRNAIPMKVNADNDIMTDDEKYGESGNFYLESGSLVLNGSGSVGEGCITVSNAINVSGGSLQTYGNHAGVYSVYGDIQLSGGNITIENFNNYGLYARRGDITVSGDADVFVNSFARTSTCGVRAGNTIGGQESGSVYFKGGDTAIEVSGYGIFAQCGDAPESGRIEVEDGVIDVHIDSSKVGVAMYAGGSEADVSFCGGITNLLSEVAGAQPAYGIYAERNIRIEGGAVSSGAKNPAATAIGANAEKTIFITGGTFTAYGDTAAIGLAAPDCGQMVKITAATDVSGENTVDYDSQNFGSYKYLIFESGEVLSVSVTPATVNVEKGKAFKFTAEVNGTGNFDGRVQWVLTGANSAGTSIDEEGLLTVAADETATTLTVTAVSVGDSEKQASSAVTVLTGESGEVLSVSVTPATVNVEKGKTFKFTAEVNGTGNFDGRVQWVLTGANSAGTSIDEEGLLTVAADETATTLTVTAVSVGDSEKQASSAVTVLTGESGEDTNQPEPSNLPTGAIVAIVAGSIIGIAVVAVLVYVIIRKKRK